MGEAKRREELGLPPRQKNELNKSDRYLSWLPITKSRIKKYPYMGCLLYTSPSPRDYAASRMPSSA